MPTNSKDQPAVGIDIVDIKRIRKILNSKQKHRIAKFFTKSELNYYLSHKDKAPHLSGIFAAKEAASKALGVGKYPFIEIEIRHNKNGAPVVYFKNRKLKVSISITHSKEVAIAVAVVRL